MKRKREKRLKQKRKTYRKILKRNERILKGRTKKQKKEEERL